MLRFFGVAAVIAGCGGFGLSLAASCRKEISMLRKLISAIQEMEWELKYRMTELPELCEEAGNAATGMIREIFFEMAGKLKRREVADLSAAFISLINQKGLPRRVKGNMKQLAQCLGRYDLDGQLQGLESVRIQCRKDLQELETDGVQYLRSYQTLALCAGVALSILLI